MSDPFVIVQEDVVAAYEQAETLLASWRKLKGKKRSPQEENEFEYLSDELFSTIKSLKSDLDDLKETIDIAQESPEDYGLSSKDLETRRVFVSSKRKAVDEMHRVLSDKPQKQTKPKAATATTITTRQVGHHAVDFSDSQQQQHNQHSQQQQQMLIEQQDEHLDSMVHTVRNLHGIAGTMNTELDDQAILLDEMDNLMDSTQNKLDSARKKVEKFLRDKNNRSIHIVIVLFLVIMLLIFLIIFT